MNAEPAGAGDRATILAQYADGPTQLENAIKGVAESDLDMAPSHINRILAIRKERGLASAGADGAM